jgi:hypothetical protein
MDFIKIFLDVYCLLLHCSYITIVSFLACCSLLDWIRASSLPLGLSFSILGFFHWVMEKLEIWGASLMKTFQKVLFSIVSIQWLTRFSVLRNLFSSLFDLLFLWEMPEACFILAFICIHACNYDLIVHSLDEDSIFEGKTWFTLQFTPNWHLKLLVNL